MWSGSGQYPSDDEADETLDQFAALRLLVSSSENLGLIIKLFPRLGNISQVYAGVNPVALADEDPSFIDEVIDLARQKEFRDWAAVTALALLAVLPQEKLAALPRESVEFVLESSESNPAQDTIARLIRDRYEVAWRGEVPRSNLV
jgi:hypothetical protein